MEKNKIIKSLVHLAKDFFTLKNKSAYDLLKNSGYFNHYRSISENDLLEEICKYPDLINHWLNYADLPRQDGWYFYENNGQYNVSFEDKNKRIPPVIFADPNKACAMYIHREIEDIRKSNSYE